MQRKPFKLSNKNSGVELRQKRLRFFISVETSCLPTYGQSLMPRKFHISLKEIPNFHPLRLYDGCKTLRGGLYQRPLAVSVYSRNSFVIIEISFCLQAALKVPPLHWAHDCVCM